MREPQQTKRSRGFKFAILAVFCNSLSVRTLHFALTTARTSQAPQTCRIALFSRIFRTIKAIKQQSESYAFTPSKLSNSITKAFSSLRWCFFAALKSLFRSLAARLFMFHFAKEKAFSLYNTTFHAPSLLRHFFRHTRPPSQNAPYPLAPSFIKLIPEKSQKTYLIIRSFYFFFVTLSPIFIFTIN